jgi:RNA polymerase sigma-70 factor (ECF subfamily)
MDEQALIQDSQAGDLNAFNRLVLAHQDQVFSVAYRIMGDQASASDATQEAFISAFGAIRRFRGGSFKAWLLRIVTNACYDELRRRKRRPASSLDEASEWSDGFAHEDDEAGWMDHPERPERAVERSELAGAIEDCLNQLPPEFKIVAVLADVQGYEYAEVAQVIDTPLGTVKSRLARARGRLRDCLQEKGELLPGKFRLEDETV